MKLQGFFSVSALLLPGCSLINSPSWGTVTSLAVKTMVALITATNGNLFRPGKVQHVRVSGNEPSPLFNDMLFPGMQQSVVIPSSTDAPRWLVIGADYRATQSLSEIRIPEDTNSRNASASVNSRCFFTRS
ncbi:hypothetical protein [Pantoea agglomerans]